MDEPKPRHQVSTFSAWMEGDKTVLRINERLLVLNSGQLAWLAGMLNAFHQVNQDNQDTVRAEPEDADG